MRCGSCGILANGALERALDDVGRVGVVADVRRQVVERLLVAGQPIEVVDAPVVRPVEQHPLGAGGRCSGRAREGERQEQAGEAREEGGWGVDGHRT